MLGQLEREVNAFMLTTNRIYGVKHTVVVIDGYHYHYFVVSYE